MALTSVMALTSNGDLWGRAVVLSKGASSKFVFVAGTLILLGGCQNVGPIAIDQGRERYNNIIQSTSKEQTFANIIRVKHHEPTVFMDVTEVDATTTFSGSVSGGVTNIGAKAGTSGGTLAGQVGSVVGGVTYSESPLIRYQPLLGQGLVAQLATPVSPDVMTSLYDSNWGIAPVLDLSTAYLVPDYDEIGAALNTITQLDLDESLEVVAEKSEVTKSKDSTKSGAIGSSGNVTLEVTNKSGGAGGTDALGIYFLHLHPHAKHRETRQQVLDKELWQRLVHLYDGTQVQCPPIKAVRNKEETTKAAAAKAGDANARDAKEAAAKAATDAAAAARAAADAADKVAAAARAAAAGSAPMAPTDEPKRPPSTHPAPYGDASKHRCVAHPDYLELRTMPVAPSKMGQGLITGAPMMRTYSALGILKNATEPPWPKIAFVDLERFHKIRSPENRPWNDPTTDADINFYTLLEEDEGENDEKNKETSEYQQETRIIEEWLKEPHHLGKPLPRVYWKKGLSNDEFVKINERLHNLRRYVLIIRANESPADAYVSYFDHGEWYYIDGHDEISQKNFDLISLFMTMMAVPSTTPPLAPTISVGGG